MSPVSLALALVPLLALAGATADGPAYEIDVADVSSAPDACPSQSEVAETLESHLPGIVARASHEPGPNLLRLAFTLSPEGVARVTMTDATGALRLERELDLPKSEGGGPGHSVSRERTACAALADTVALIVERYMRHLGYHEPPPPSLVTPTTPRSLGPPPPVTPARPDAAARLGLGVSARPPWGASWRFEPGLVAAVRLRHLELGGSLAVGLSGDQAVPMSDGTLTLMTYPARVSAGWALPLSARVSLIPAVAGGVDVVQAETRGIDKTRRSTALEPSAEIGVTALWAVTQRVWVELHTFGGVDIRPEEFQVTGSTGQLTDVFMTPRVYTRLGVDFGVFLGKN
jgi:hypothetical protein